jgi:hypothetical protein
LWSDIFHTRWIMLAPDMQGQGYGRQMQMMNRVGEQARWSRVTAIEIAAGHLSGSSSNASEQKSCGDRLTDGDRACTASTWSCARELTPRPRLLDPWDTANVLSEEVDQQPDSSNARALRDNQHAQWYRRQGIVRQDRLEPASGHEIVDKPLMSGCDAAPSDKGLARGKPMVDPKTSAEGHRMAFAAWPLQSERVASRHVRHSNALMPRQIPRDSRSSSRRQIIRRCDEQTPALAEGPQLHGAVGERTQAKCDIDALPHKVDAFIGEAEVDPDVGISILKGEDQPADVQDPESRRAGYPDRAGRRSTRASRPIAGLFHKAQDLDAVGIIAAAFIGHRDTPGGSAEQRHADGLLEFSQMPRDRRLPDTELTRYRRQAPALGDTDERSHALERYVRSIH